MLILEMCSRSLLQCGLKGFSNISTTLLLLVKFLYYIDRNCYTAFIKNSRLIFTPVRL
jgi:hypothetical protein